MRLKLRRPAMTGRVAEEYFLHSTNVARIIANAVSTDAARRYVNFYLETVNAVGQKEDDHADSD